jgi:hypothetical protein
MRLTAKRLTATIGAVAVAGASAALLSAGSASADPAHGGIISGPEALAGSVYGPAAISQAPTVPLRLRGVVNTFGSVFLGGPSNAKRHTVYTNAGALNVVVFTSTATQSSYANPRTCFAVFTEREAFRVIGGTGAFFRASGPGTVQIRSGAFVPRYRYGPKRGRCNVNGSPVTARGAFINFYAQVTPLTIRVHR